MAVGGFFYLSLSPKGFLSATGSTGSSLITGGFSSFGYTYFFIVIFLLHMGHMTLATAHTFRDMIRGMSIYMRSSAIYFTVLLLISSFLTVLQSYNGWAPSTHFAFGYGGWFGTQIGGFLFRSFGLYGAMVLLFSMTSVIGISAGYMEIVHSFYVMKDIFKEILKNTRDALAIFGSLLTAVGSYSRSPEFNQALDLGVPSNSLPIAPTFSTSSRVVR